MPLVRNTRRGSFVAAGVEFKPGPTEIGDEALLRVLADPSAASWFDRGLLLLDDAGPTVAAAAVEPEAPPAVEAKPVEDAPKEKSPRRRRGG